MCLISHKRNRVKGRSRKSPVAPLLCSRLLLTFDHITWIRRYPEVSAPSPVGGRGPHASVNLDAQVVVDGMAKLLLTAKVSLHRLDGGVAQKKLNLVQVPSG